jgi:hypothetical protein
LLSWTKSSDVTGDSSHIYSSSPFPASDQVQGSGYSESEVETDMVALQLETSAVTLELETNVVGLKLETSTPALELEIALDLETETDMP